MSLYVNHCKWRSPKSELQGVVKFSDRKASISPRVLSLPYTNMILGVDFMLQHQVSIFIDKLEAKIGEVMVPLHHHGMLAKPVTCVGISELVRRIQNNHIITETDRRATIAVLQQFSTVFDESVSGNRTTTVQHSIFTGDHMPLHQPPRRVPV